MPDVKRWSDPMRLGELVSVHRATVRVCVTCGALVISNQDGGPDDAALALHENYHNSISRLLLAVIDALKAVREAVPLRVRS